MKLRPYQSDAVERIRAALSPTTPVLAAMATGTGKTVVLSHLAHKEQGRTLVIGHTTEIIDQTRDKIASVTGEVPDVEMGGRRADAYMFRRTRCVVTSVQTQSRGRMKRFKPNDFSLVIVDEAHHGHADSYQSVLRYFRTNPDLRVLGLTATPDKALSWCPRVAYEYPIQTAISDGWLVGIRQRFIEVGGLDYSKCRTVRGDISALDLAAVMQAEEMLHSIARPVLDLYNRRHTVVFCPSVEHATRLSEVLCRYEPNCAAMVCGETPILDRINTIRSFRDGTGSRILCNVGVFTEGLDVPEIGLVVMARATKSHTLYTQMIGRGTRAVASGLDCLDCGEARRMLIAQSRKPHLDVLDFVGNSGRHRLCSVIDVLRPDLDEDVRDAARCAAIKSGDAANMESLSDEALDAKREKEERERLAAVARRAKITARVDYHTEDVDPFSGAKLLFPEDNTYTAVSEGLSDLLSRNGYDARKMSAEAAKRLGRQIIVRRKRGLCSIRQVGLLRKYGVDGTNMSMKDAGSAIDRIKAGGWMR